MCSSVRTYCGTMLVVDLYYHSEAAAQVAAEVREAAGVPAGGSPLPPRPLDVLAHRAVVSGAKRAAVLRLMAQSMRARKAKLEAMGAMYSLAKEQWEAKVRPSIIRRCDETC
jgi:hypothetical protein